METNTTPHITSQRVGTLRAAARITAVLFDRCCLKQNVFGFSKKADKRGERKHHTTAVPRPPNPPPSKHPSFSPTHRPCHKRKSTSAPHKKETHNTPGMAAPSHYSGDTTDDIGDHAPTAIGTPTPPRRILPRGRKRPQSPNHATHPNQRGQAHRNKQPIQHRALAEAKSNGYWP